MACHYRPRKGRHWPVLTLGQARRLYKMTRSYTSRNRVVTAYHSSQDFSFRSDRSGRSQSHAWVILSENKIKKCSDNPLTEEYAQMPALRVPCRTLSPTLRP
jgi:hypothetical protein